MWARTGSDRACRMPSTVTPAVRLDADTVRRYADLGVGRLIPFEGGGEKELLEFVTRTRDTLIGRF